MVVVVTAPNSCSDLRCAAVLVMLRAFLLSLCITLLVCVMHHHHHHTSCRACNRLGIDSTTSPLLKMSYETAAKFLTDAALTGSTDSLASPSARLVVGAVTEVGTGCCQLLHEG